MTSQKMESGVESEKFPWDFNNSNTLFWNDPVLAPPLPRNFLTCFTAEEIKDMNLDALSHLIKDGKLSFLLHLIQAKYKARKAKAAPLPFYDTAWEDW